jgi:hypothetical protein
VSDRLNETPKTPEQTSFSLADQIVDAGRGAFDELAQKPYQSIRQAASHMGGIELPEWHPVKPPEQNSIGAAAGRLAAGVVEFWGLSLGVGKLAGIGRLAPTSTVASETIKMAGTSGAISLLQPLEGDQDFAKKKLFSLAEGAGAGAAFGGVAGGLNKFGLFGRAGQRGLIGESLANGVAGLGAGTVAGATDWISGNKSLGDAMDTVATSAITGAGFGVLNRAVFGRTPISLTRHPDGRAADSALKTERWVSENYDGREPIRSPILTLLAEKNPALRPPNYEPLREAAFAQKRTDLSLGDWAPEQRPAVIQALRKWARTDLANDSNLDAIISRFNRPEVAQRLDRLNSTFSDLDFRLGMIAKHIERHPELSDLRPYQVARTMPLEKVQKRDSTLGVIRQDIVNLERVAASTEAYRAASATLRSELNAISRESGMPPVAVALDYGTYGVYNPVVGQKINRKFVLGDSEIIAGFSGGLTATNVEIATHEWNHHRQGFLGYEPWLHALKRATYYPVAKKVGLIDEIPALQQTKTSEQYIHHYVAMRMETESWSVGLLTRIRAMMAGLPQGKGL